MRYGFDNALLESIEQSHISSEPFVCIRETMQMAERLWKKTALCKSLESA
jgi:hypothetical protein